MPERAILFDLLEFNKSLSVVCLSGLRLAEIATRGMDDVVNEKSQY